MKKGAFWGILQRPFLLVFVFAVTLIMSILLIGCDDASDGLSPETPPAGQESSSQQEDNEQDNDQNNGQNNNDENEEKNEWDISASPVKAELVADGDRYTLNISGSGDMKSWAKAEEVPWYAYSEKITAVTIGDKVTAIGDYAFSAIRVEKFMLPGSVKSVGGYALPGNATVFAYENTQIDSEQNGEISVCTFSESVPATQDRHWTSWGSSGNITDAPFGEEKLYWHFDGQNNPVLWEKIKVLFIGNSFTFYYQIPAQFDAIAEDLGYYIETYSIAVPGQTLETHADSASNSGVQIDALLDKTDDFDYVVLQEQSTRPYNDYDKFLNAVKALKKKIDDTQTHAKVYLYETWGSPASAGNTYDQIAEMEQKLYDAYTQAASDTGCKVSYVGRAFTFVKRETELNLYYGDNRHPGPVGSYLSACVHVATILGGDVRKTVLTGADLAVIPNEGGSAQPLNLTEAHWEPLRAAAYQTVSASEEPETYTIRFWYNGQVQTTKTAAVGYGFILPSCTVENGEKFTGWKLGSDDAVYPADSRVGYSAVSAKISEGVVDFYAQSLEMVIAVWGRWITEENFLRVLDGFKTYCTENELNCDKVGYVYYAGKTQGVDPYFLIADFTGKVAEDEADIVFPCGDNIAGAQSKIATSVTDSKALGVSVEGNTTRYVAKLNEKRLTDAFYVYITTDGAKAILSSLT